MYVLHTYSIYSRTPKDHMSVTVVTGSPVKISGATCKEITDPYISVT